MIKLKAGVIATPHDEGMSFHRGSDVIAVTERETKFYLKSEADAAIAKLNAENERLKRALWIARAELCRRLDVDRYLRKHINSWYNKNCLTWAEACVAMEVKMCNAESKCRAKAEKFK